MEYKNLECRNCGATLQFDPASVSMKCSFCGSEHLIEYEIPDDQKTIYDDAEVILFNIDKEKAKSIFKQYIKKGFFKPKSLKDLLKTMQFDGTYIPFIKINLDAETKWQGKKRICKESEDYGVAVHKYIKSEIKHEFNEKKGRYESRTGVHNEHYKDFISATKGLNQFEVDMILPFDDNITRPFNNQLLMGYKNERPAVKIENALYQAHDRIKRKEKNECNRKVDQLIDTNTVITKEKFNLIMLPLWIIVYSFKNEVYRIIINGQSGKIFGKKPVSKIKIVMFLVSLLMITASVALLMKHLLF